MLFNFLGHDLLTYLFSVDWNVVFQLEQSVILTKVLKNPESSSNTCRVILFVITKAVAISESVVHTFKVP